MVGISKSKYEHLQDAITVLEEILVGLPEQQNFEQQLFMQSREQLEIIFKEYEVVFEKVAYLSRYYRDLAADVKVNYSRTVKQLKNTLPVETKAYQRLKDGIRIIKDA